MKKLGIVLFIIGVGVIIFGLGWIIADEINKETCYNSTPSEFFKNEKCNKYWNKKYTALTEKYNVCKKERDEYFNLYDQTYGILVDEGLVGE